MSLEEYHWFAGDAQDFRHDSNVKKEKPPQNLKLTATRLTPRLLLIPAHSTILDFITSKAESKSGGATAVKLSQYFQYFQDRRASLAVRLNVLGCRKGHNATFKRMWPFNLSGRCL